MVYFTTPWWQNAGAEMKGRLSLGLSAIKDSLFYAWSRSEYGFLCFICCREFCLIRFDLSSSFNFIFLQSSANKKVFDVWRVNRIFVYELTNFVSPWDILHSLERPLNIKHVQHILYKWRWNDRTENWQTDVKRHVVWAPAWCSLLLWFLLQNNTMM